MMPAVHAAPGDPLSTLEQRLIRALAAAAIDPGELNVDELADRVRLGRRDVLRVVRSLVAGGYLVHDHDWVTWTEKGRRYAITHHYPSSHRT